MENFLLFIAAYGLGNICLYLGLLAHERYKRWVRDRRIEKMLLEHDRHMESCYMDEQSYKRLHRFEMNRYLDTIGLRFWKPNLLQRFSYWAGIRKDPRYNGEKVNYPLHDEVGQY